jgi:hypothetical protein
MSPTRVDVMAARTGRRRLSDREKCGDADDRQPGCSFTIWPQYKATHSRVRVYDHFVLRLLLQTQPYF